MLAPDDAIDSEKNGDEPVDFLQSMMDAGDDQEEEEEQKIAASTTDTALQYNPKKPTWWKKISGKPTKAQKRSMVAMEPFRLPKLEYGQLLDWDAVFTTPSETKEIWLEIGFGTGDNLLALAHRHCNLNRCFVGAEVHAAGLGKLCQRMHQAIDQESHWGNYELFSDEKANQVREIDPNGADNNDRTLNDASNRESSEVLATPNTTPYSNLRFFGGDGVKLLPYIPNDSLSAVLVTFPDPFPKEAQAAYRVVQNHTLLELYRILKSQGRFYLATDHEGHFEWCHKMVNRVNDQGDTAPFSLVPHTDRTEWLPAISKYEQKGWNEGRSTHLSCWEVVK